MRSARLYILAGLTLAGAMVGGYLVRATLLKVTVTRVMDRRCRGGCDSSQSVLQVLVGGPTSAQVCAGVLGDSIGRAITDTRSTGKYCTKADGTLTFLSANQIAVEPKGILVESAATNLVLYSQDMANATWAAANSGAAAPTVTGNAAIAPDGTMTAARVDMPAVSALQYSVKYQGITTPGAGVYTVSVWLKAVSGSPKIYLGQTTDSVTYESVLCAPTTSAWTRYSVTSTSLGSGIGDFVQLGVDTRDSGENPQGASSVYVWGWQVEAGSYASSYFPTTSSTATRGGDIVTGPALTTGTTPSWSADAIINTDLSTNPRVLEMGNGPDDRWALFTLGGGSLDFDYNNGSEFNCIVGSSIANGVTAHYVASYDGATMRASVAGASNSTSRSFTASNVNTLISFGCSDIFGSNQINGWISNIKISNSPTGAQ